MDLLEFILEQCNSEKPRNTSKHLTGLSHLTLPSIFHLIHPCSHDQRRSRGRKQEQCSLTSGKIEWHFYDVFQIIPWDGWAKLELQLINPSTGGMCCGCPPPQLFFFFFPLEWKIQTDMLERMTNEKSNCRYLQCWPACSRCLRQLCMCACLLW